MNPETRKYINKEIKRELGISYDEFELLDFDEQQKLIEQNKKRKKFNKKYIKVMIGNEEHTIFVNAKRGKKYMLDDGTLVVVGNTPMQSKSRLEDMFADSLYSKPVAFVKKLERRIKNR